MWRLRGIYRCSTAITGSTRRTVHCVPSEACVALFVGKFVPWKRPMDLLDAAARVPELYVVMIGDGVLRSSLEESARRYDLADRVLFLGFTNQAALPEVYAASDALVLPSGYEPFGLVVNEAFAVGRPLVTRACGAAGELVQDGVTGHVVDVGDTEALADRLRILARKPSLLEAMGRNAQARIAEWGPDQNAEAFVHACLSLQGRH